MPTRAGESRGLRRQQQELQTAGELQKRSKTVFKVSTPSSLPSVPFVAAFFECS